MSEACPELVEGLDDFIHAEAGKAFRWGETDCATTADRWVRLSLGFSPMAAYGRLHGNEAQAKAWLDEPGGIAVAFNRVMRAAGLAKTREPRAGDIGLVLLSREPVERSKDGPAKLCIAIHAGRCWFSHDERGLIAAPLAAVWKAWRVECRR